MLALTVGLDFLHLSRDSRASHVDKSPDQETTSFRGDLRPSYFLTKETTMLHFYYEEIEQLAYAGDPLVAEARDLGFQLEIHTKCGNRKIFYIPKLFFKMKNEQYYGEIYNLKYRGAETTRVLTYLCGALFSLWLLLFLYLMIKMYRIRSDKKSQCQMIAIGPAISSVGDATMALVKLSSKAKEFDLNNLSMTLLLDTSNAVALRKIFYDTGALTAAFNPRDYIIVSHVYFPAPETQSFLVRQPLTLDDTSSLQGPNLNNLNLLADHAFKDFIMESYQGRISSD